MMRRAKFFPVSGCGQRASVAKVRRVGLLAAVGAVASFIPMLGTADAAFPGQNGKIAYERSVGTPGDNSEIFVMEPDGSGQTNLTNTADAGEFQPAWSPNGQKIAYQRSGDTPGIWVMNADGSGQTRLTDSGGKPSWSPDGNKIVFEISGQVLWVVNADGTGLAVLVAPPNGYADQPAWSPNGQRIAFISFADIWLVDADGTNLVNITDNDITTYEEHPDWKPDGSRIVFFRRTPNGPDQVLTMHPDGSDLVDVTPTVGAPQTPAWSPDGTRIVLLAGSGGDFGLRTMGSDGGALSAPLDPFGINPDWQPLQALPPTTTTSSTTTLPPTTTTSSTTTLPPTTTTTVASTRCNPPTSGISGFLFRLTVRLPVFIRSTIQNLAIALCRIGW